MINQVNIPEGLAWHYSTRQQIIRVQNDILSEDDLFDRIVHHQKKCRLPRSTEIILEFTSPSKLRRLSNYRWNGPRVTVLISDEQVSEIQRNRSQLAIIQPTLILEKCKGSLPRTIQFLASLNLPIEVSPTVFSHQKHETFVDLAERLLFSPFIKIPIQPF